MCVYVAIIGVDIERSNSSKKLDPNQNSYVVHSFSLRNICQGNNNSLLRRPIGLCLLVIHFLSRKNAASFEACCSPRVCTGSTTPTTSTFAIVFFFFCICNGTSLASYVDSFVHADYGLVGPIRRSTVFVAGISPSSCQSCYHSCPGWRCNPAFSWKNVIHWNCFFARFQGRRPR